MQDAPTARLVGQSFEVANGGILPTTGCIDIWPSRSGAVPVFVRIEVSALLLTFTVSSPNCSRVVDSVATGAGAVRPVKLMWIEVLEVNGVSPT